jgi:hypothetical protein
MALWTRKGRRTKAPEPAPEEPVETVKLDDDQHAWWTQAEVENVWKPRDRTRKEPEKERDILAEHFGDDWRTNFLYTGPTEAELEEERRREQQALDDQDPYKVLQVSEDASWDDIVVAHRHMARVHHPDRLFGQSEEEKRESEERIRVINQAYQELRVRRGM